MLMYDILDFRFAILEIKNLKSKIACPFYWFMILVYCVLYLGSFSVFAEDSELAAYSTLPYLKNLSHERIQPGVLHLYLSTRDAHIYLDGKSSKDLEKDGVIIVQRTEKGTPILAFENLIPGTYILRVTKRSHNTVLKYVSIEPKGTTTVNIGLHNRWRFLAVEITALVLLTGLSIGIAFIISS